MFRKIDDFFEVWKTEKDSTLKVFDNLTDQSLSQKVTEEGRSLGFIAWHLTLSLGEMLSAAGIQIGGFDPMNPEPMPKTAKEISDKYENLAMITEDLIRDSWTDKQLSEEINMFGEMWNKGKILAILIHHQTHHRGQMTVLMRQAGLKVPGVCGPSKEEWHKYGVAEQP